MEGPSTSLAPEGPTWSLILQGLHLGLHPLCRPVPQSLMNLRSRPGGAPRATDASLGLRRALPSFLHWGSACVMRVPKSRSHWTYAAQLWRLLGAWPHAMEQLQTQAVWHCSQGLRHHALLHAPSPQPHAEGSRPEAPREVPRVWWLPASLCALSVQRCKLPPEV